MNNNPWLSIWTSPSKTIREIVSTNPKRGLFILALIVGLQCVLRNYDFFSKSYNLSYVSLIVLVILSPAIGYLLFYFFSLLFLWTGKLFKGRAPFSHILSAYAWSCLPLVMTLAVLALNLVILGVTLPFVNFVSVVASIWSFILLVNCMKEVQGYSVWKAIGNILLPTILVSAIFGLIVGMYFSASVG